VGHLRDVPAGSLVLAGNLVVNPQVRNPHLIFPGDVLTLVYMDGQPRIVLERGEYRRGVERLQPRVRVEAARGSDLHDSLRPHCRVPEPPRGARSRDDRLGALHPGKPPRHLAHGSQTEVYVRGAEFAENDDLTASCTSARRCAIRTTAGCSATRAIYVGEGRVVRTGDPATLLPERHGTRGAERRQAAPGRDRFPAALHSARPGPGRRGADHHVLDGVSRVGAYQIVTLNRGARHGLEPGHVLSVWQAGERVRTGFGGGRVQLPDEYAGYLMIFRTFDDLSYGLIMQASNEIRVLDRVRNP
jgi:hypothetical protein